jgi:ribosomal protein S18 acetylase RimI-like enzyme
VTSSDSSPGTVAGIKIRKARRGDASPVVALLSENNVVSDISTFNWIISHPEMEIFVAADSFDKPIGFLTLSHRPMMKASGRAASVDELVVSTNHRRKGIGRELLRQGVERARVLGIRRLQLEVATEDAGVSAFLLACGLTQVEWSVFQCQPYR